MRFRQLFAAVPLSVLALVTVGAASVEGCPWWNGYGRGAAPRYYYSPPPPPAPAYYPYDQAPRPNDQAPKLMPAPGSNRPTTNIDIGAQDNSFAPSSVNVQPGTTVRWVNKGNHTHTITSNDSKWDSGELAPGEVYSITFVTPGTYRYHCKHHKGMEGSITVTKPEPPVGSK